MGDGIVHRRQHAGVDRLRALDIEDAGQSAHALLLPYNLGQAGIDKARMAECRAWKGDIPMNFLT
jgi:hypothetical protein